MPALPEIYRALDPGIKDAVELLRNADIPTTGSCDGKHDDRKSLPCISVEVANESAFSSTREKIVNTLLQAWYGGFTVEEHRLYQKSPKTWMTLIHIKFWGEAKPDEDVMRAWIDAASFEDLLRRQRTAAIGDLIFTGAVGKYYQKVLGEKRKAVGTAEAVRASKNIRMSAVRLTTIKPKRVEYIPKVEDMEDGIIYISPTFGMTIHKCCCGCGNQTVTPIGLDKGGWGIMFNSYVVTLTPSIGNFQFPCKSHYFIRNNKVVWL